MNEMKIITNLNDRRPNALTKKNMVGLHVTKFPVEHNSDSL